MTDPTHIQGCDMDFKANQLIDKFLKICNYPFMYHADQKEYLTYAEAQQCAIIFCDEMILECKIYRHAAMGHWQNLKKIIENKKHTK